MADTPTFVFGEDGRTYAYLDGKIVASATDADELEQKLATWPDVHEVPGGPHQHQQDFTRSYPEGLVAPDPQGLGVCQACNGEGAREGFGGCPHCGGTGQEPDPQDPAAPGAAVDPLQGASPDTLPGDNLPPRATHITTPNGLKGQILGKVKGLWGEQVTIRLENGRIAKFDVTDSSKVSFVEEKDTPSSPYGALEARLAATPDGTKASLVARIKELKAIKNDAAAVIRTAQYVDQETVHNLVVQADYELREVTDALAALEDAEPYAAPAPFSTGVAEQESMGGHDSTWLDNVVEDMVAENESLDFDQMIDEVPEVMAAELETPVLEDAGAVRDRAEALVTSKTAGLEPQAAADFRAAFLTRVEACRRAELGRREEREEVQSKTASSENYDGPAEGLFM